MRVQDIMTSNVACCTPDTPLNQVARLMVEHDCGEIPVAEGNGKLVGVITDRDIVCRSVAHDCNPCEMSAAEIMTTQLVCANPNMDVDEACQLMEQNQIRRIPVVDENGCCCGIVSQADIATKIEGMTEQLVEHVSQPSQSSSGYMR